MLVDGLLLILGIGLLIAGGRAFVDGASLLATSLGVSELAIGLTVLAFGTSAPELAVNGLAAVRGSTAIAFGNVIGSNIANVALVIGLCAWVRPLRFESVIVSREIPMMFLATVAALILGLDRIRGAPEAYDRSDGLLLLLLFSLFLYYTISEVVAGRTKDPLAKVAVERLQSSDFWSARRAGFLGAAGLGMLLVGAHLTVTHAVLLAEALEVPRAVIGLTVIAVGTSLPELTTSLVATWKGKTSLAVGNVVGSNIFNLLFVLGITAVIRPVDLPETHGGADLAALLLFSAVLLPISHAQGARVVRWEGIALVAAYLGYLAWRV